MNIVGKTGYLKYYNNNKYLRGYKQRKLTFMCLANYKIQLLCFVGKRKS